MFFVQERGLAQIENKIGNSDARLSQTPAINMVVIN